MLDTYCMNSVQGILAFNSNTRLTVFVTENNSYEETRVEFMSNFKTTVECMELFALLLVASL